MALRFSPYGNAPLLLPSMLPASGYQLFVYHAQTTTKATIYADILGASQHTNPIILGSDGWPPQSIYLDDANNYRFVYAHPLDSDPPTTQIVPPVDNVALVTPAAQILASDWTVGPTPTFISSTQFSVTGDQTGTFHTGRRVRTQNTGGTGYHTITASVFSSVTTVTVLNDTTALDSGLSDVAYAFLSANTSSWPGGRSVGLDTTFHGDVSIPVDNRFNIIPAALITAYAGISPPPPGWLLCDGTPVSRTTYQYLYQTITVLFGAGDTVSTFNVPTIADLQANVVYIIRHA